jgi:hypothetical protein
MRNNASRAKKFFARVFFARSGLEANKYTASIDGRIRFLIHSFWSTAKQVLD